MKRLNQFLLIAGLLAVCLNSCKKDEKQIYFNGGTAPVLTASRNIDSTVLLKANKTDTLISFSWTNPEYNFTTGTSSQDVTYKIQVDTAGVNFTSPNMQEQSISKDLAITLHVGDLNSFLSKMELKAGVAYNVEIRIKSTLANNSVPLYSNVIKINHLIPYLDFSVEPPGTSDSSYLDGNLWMTGDATAAPSYPNPVPSPYDITQKFRRIDVLHYILDSVNYTNGSGHYKLIQKQGIWSTQYHALSVTNTSTGNTGDIEKKDSDPGFAAPGIGWYKVELNFQTGKYTQTKL